MTDSRILVGIVGAPHGIRGEMRLKSLTSDPLAIAGYGPLQGEGGRRLVLTAARVLKDDMLVVRAADVSTRDAAAALTNTRLFIDRAALPAVEEDEFYHADLIGLRAVSESGQDIGRVVAVNNHGGGDHLEVEGEGGASVLIPFTLAFVPRVEVAAGRLVVADSALDEGDADEGEPDDAPAREGGE